MGFVRSAAFLAALALATGAAAADFRLLRLDGVELKWDSARRGTPAAVSYGFATSDAAFPDAVNCREMTPLDALAPIWGGDPGRLASIVRSAFAMWSGAAAIAFRPALAGEAPDILIGAEATPRKIAFTNVWHDDPAPDASIAALTRATICLNPEAPWGAAGRDGLDFRTVLAHEIGHAIGLDHPGATGALMGYSNQGGLAGLMPGDVAGAVALYGPNRAGIAR
ncbi:MAG TPA: matrixin family metalloprotease [Amaricoccus sp.]|jgi:hypothetical protein|nr:matrixin family metalloprotease [Amaricoccus sp.]